MRKLIVVTLCVFVILLTGCQGRKMSPADVALQQFEQRLENAIESDDLLSIKVNDITVSDAALIERWLDTLQELELEAIPFNGGVNGEVGYVLSFVYPMQEVQLGVFFSGQIDLYYNGSPAEYTLIIRNEDDTSQQLQELAEESGFDFRLF